MSRQPTWDMALALQADMFHAVKAVGGLDVQLVYFRGAGECRASKWVSDPDALARADDARHLPRRLHADRQGAEARAQRRPAKRRQRARLRRRLHGGGASTICAGAPASWRCWACRCSCSRRARTPAPRRAFREIARLTKGAYCRFDAGSAAQLRELLSAVAVYAAGGRKALAGAAPGAARRAPAAAAARSREARRIPCSTCCSGLAPCCCSCSPCAPSRWPIRPCWRASCASAPAWPRWRAPASCVLRGMVGYAMSLAALGYLAAVGRRRTAVGLSGPRAEVGRADLARRHRSPRDGARSRQRRDARPRAEGLLRRPRAREPDAGGAGASLAGLPLRRSAVGAAGRGLSRPRSIRPGARTWRAPRASTARSGRHA